MSLPGLEATVIIRIGTSGEIEAIQAGYSWRNSFESIDLLGTTDPKELPEFLLERMALLKITPIDRVNFKGGVVGRKLSDRMYVVYLTYDEFKQLKELSNQGE